MKDNSLVLVKGAAVPAVLETPAGVPAVNLASLVDEWLKFTKKHSGVKSAQSERTYRGAVKQLFIYFREHGKDVLTATDDDVYEWLEHLKATKADSTVQMYLVAARLFFAFLYKQKVISENPAEGMKAGVKDNRDHKRDYLTTLQVKEIFAAMPTDTVKELRNRAVVALMVTCGLRCLEVARAQYGDLRVVGDSHVLYVQGKGHTSKDAFVKIEPTVEKFIREYLAVRFGGKAVKDKDYLFVSTSRNRGVDSDDELSTQAIRAIVKDAMKAIGLNDSRHTAHSLRHTAATLAIKAGEELTNVQAMLRHKNITTTMIYNHALEREKINPEAAVGKMIFGA